jgi:GT2 family glycosyltransferase
VVYGPQRRTTYASLLFEGNAVSTSAVVVRRSLLETVGGFCEEPGVVTAEDYDLWMRLAQAGCVFAMSDRILGEYLLHAGNHSKAVTRHLQAELSVLDRHFAAMDEPGALTRLRMRRRRALARYAAAREMHSSGRPGEALRMLAGAAREFPFIARLYAAGCVSIIAKLRRGAE